MNDLGFPISDPLPAAGPGAIDAGSPEAEVPLSSELSALYEHAPLGFAVLDMHLRFLSINRWLASVSGLPASDHLGKRLPDLVPGLADQAQAALRHVLETGRPLPNVEFVGETRATPGVVRHWLDHWFPIRDRRGAITAVGVVVREMTGLRRLAHENHRVAAAPAASEARHAFLVRLHDQMRLIPDPDELAYRACCLLSEQMRVNRAGFALPDADDGTAWVLRHDVDGVRHALRQDPSAFGEAFVAALRDGRTVVECDVRGAASLTQAERRAHSSCLTRAFVVVPVRDAGRLAAMFFVDSCQARNWTRDEVSLIETVAERTHDAMQRAHAARRLRDSEQQLRLVKAAAGICIYDDDMAAGTCRWDEGLRSLWGLAPDQALTRDALRAAIPPEDLARVDAAKARAIDPSGPGTLHVEHRVRRETDGREIRVLLTGVVTFCDGVPVRNVGTVQDVTALGEAQSALRESDRLKDEFLAMLAHELRNPLAPLRNALRYIERCDVPERCVAPLRIANRQVQHMTRLVEDLLEVSRIGLGVFRVHPERLMVQQAVFAVAEALSPTLEERRQRLEHELPDMPLWVDADPTRFAQVIRNLITNASKYSETGGTITLQVGSQGREVFVGVHDDGIGIASQNLSRVFELFAQVDDSVDRSEGGLGIGLALVKRLVEVQGGRVAVVSEGLGKGSTFTAWFPACAEIGN
jgi:PAS domain S-box-containing protein